LGGKIVIAREIRASTIALGDCRRELPAECLRVQRPVGGIELREDLACPNPVTDIYKSRRDPAGYAEGLHCLNARLDYRRVEPAVVTCWIFPGGLYDHQLGFALRAIRLSAAPKQVHGGDGRRHDEDPDHAVQLGRQSPGQMPAG
jgi:hypothetical protein